jgi:CheY-like chemotaxis protein/signal transduction histidine kinase
VFDERQREFYLRSTYGMNQELIAALRKGSVGLDDPNLAHAIAQGDPIQVADLQDDAQSPLNEIILRAGFRARLVAPLIHGGEVVGMLVVRRRTPGAFPANTVDLMRTFAAQSVLAIQNARLFHEIEDKGHQIEAASKHKSQFLTNMSHELRTPLNAILGYTELILDSIYGEAPEKMRSVLERVQANGKHLLGLINDVLDLSKIEAGQLTLSLSQYSLAELVQSVYVAVEPLAAQKNLTLTTDVAKGLADRIRRRAPARPGAAQSGRQRHQVYGDGRSGDHRRADQRLIQCGGARQRTRHRSRPSGENFRGISAGRQHVDPAERRQRLGPRYFQTYRRNAWWAQRRNLYNKTSGQDRQWGKRGMSKRILVVEDQEDNRRILRDLLTSVGFQLVEAEDGAQGVAAAETHRPDLILMDIQMPVVDGYEATRQIKANPALKTIPVIVVTSYALSGDEDKARAAGCDDYITKPYSPRQLLAKIKEHLH